jgi:hypothetical protein
MFLPVLLLAVSIVTPSAATTPAAKQELRSAVGAVLRGHGGIARSTLQSISPADLDAKDRAFRECALSRLNPTAPLSPASEVPAGNTFARDLLTLYRTYWRASALYEAARPVAEKVLITGLTKLLGRPVADVSAAEPMIAARLKATGLFSQQGRTGVFHDLMMWSRETQRVQQVALPEGGNATQINYLDGFVSRGWSRYFTCNRTGTGGWTTDDGLFVIVPSYDSLTDEAFKVNFLAHESQHYADKKRFSDMPSWRLEYRAKLVEIAYAYTTLGKTLDYFMSSQGDDPSDPHSYANRRVLKALEDRLGVASASELHTVPIDRMHESAVAALKADSAALDVDRRGAAKS